MNSKVSYRLSTILALAYATTAKVYGKAAQRWAVRAWSYPDYSLTNVLGELAYRKSFESN